MLEYRIVCAHFGSADHGSHAWPKRDLEKARQSKIDLDHHASIQSSSWYRREAPYDVQTREVEEWATVTEIEDLFRRARTELEDQGTQETLES